ncbi:MAG TPA: threonine synthase [Rhodospirillaceae bacterium]|nr:threonine synthase [Rhodospirillaceae bacterium]
MAGLRSFVTHLECSFSFKQYEPGYLYNLSDADRPLIVRYDLAAIEKAVAPSDLAARPQTMWRYEELLPVPPEAEIVSLGESWTPLVALPRIAEEFGGGEVLVKDEGRMPTGSFKARGLALAVTMAKALGVTHIAMPTAGNAGAALAAYCSRAGLRATVFCPEDAPEVTVREIAFHGAETYRVNGLINHCGELVAEGAKTQGWYDLSTLKEPYRIEGKKTMGLELAEQLEWEVPDVIFYPTGGGTGLIGMWKAFLELAELGWIGPKRPRMVAVQSTGCGPLVKAFDEGMAFVEEPWEPVTTNLHGVRVPKPLGDFLCLQVMRDSNGFGVMVSDEDVAATRAETAHIEGFHLGPEGAACLAAYKQALDQGRISESDQAVIFNCGNGLKSELPPMERTLDRHGKIDFGTL